MPPVGLASLSLEVGERLDEFTRLEGLIPLTDGRLRKNPCLDHAGYRVVRSRHAATDEVSRTQRGWNGESRGLSAGSRLCGERAQSSVTSAERDAWGG